MWQAEHFATLCEVFSDSYLVNHKPGLQLQAIQEVATANSQLAPHSALERLHMVKSRHTVQFSSRSCSDTAFEQICDSAVSSWYPLLTRTNRIHCLMLYSRVLNSDASSGGSRGP